MRTALALNSVLTYTEYSALTDGWLARYEIWSVTEDPIKVLDLRINLDPMEVRLQIQQSLWSTGDYEASMKLQFPLSICPEVHSFSVLRTVCSLIKSSKNELSLRFVTVPMDFNDDLAANWKIQHKSKGNGAVIGQRDQKLINWPPSDHLYEYLYWLSFSADSRYLFFIDNEFAKPSTMAVFQLNRSGDLKVGLAGSKILPAGGFDEKRSGVTASFHPTKLLVTFTLANTAYLWGFGSGMAET